jgi:hypothetical protein
MHLHGISHEWLCSSGLGSNAIVSARNLLKIRTHKFQPAIPVSHGSPRTYSEFRTNPVYCRLCRRNRGRRQVSHRQNVSNICRMPLSVLHQRSACLQSTGLVSHWRSLRQGTVLLAGSNLVVAVARSHSKRIFPSLLWSLSAHVVVAMTG